MINGMLTGAIAMASMVAALFFLRFWRSTQDRFFLYFAISFFIEGLNRVLLSPMTGKGDELSDYPYYLLRLVAYGLILFAIYDKNRSRHKGE